MDEDQWTRSRPRDDKPPAAPKPLVVALFTEGRAAVITPNPEKLKKYGLTIKQLDALRRQRFVPGEWKAEIAGRKFNLADLATILERDLRIPPFVVALPDGREALITPDVKKVGRYLVTGEAFMDDVRARLANPFLDNPAAVDVLSGIPVPGGHVPNFWRPDHIHISTGEPLDKFAKVEIRGKPGPQADDLRFMRTVRRNLKSGLELAKGMSRDEFEKQFGRGEKQKSEPDPHFKTVGPWIYRFNGGRLSVFYNEETSRIDSICAETDSPLPSGTPQEFIKKARSLALAERALLTQFLSKRYRSATPLEKAALSDFLDKTDSDIHWTPKERREILSH